MSRNVVCQKCPNAVTTNAKFPALVSGLARFQRLVPNVFVDSLLYVQNAVLYRKVCSRSSLSRVVSRLCKAAEVPVTQQPHVFLVTLGADRMRKALSGKMSAMNWICTFDHVWLTFVPAFVHQLHYHVDLVHCSAIEVLANVGRQLLLRHSPLLFASSHRR